MSLLTALSIFAATLLLIAAPVQAFPHLVLASVRRLRGKPWNFDRDIVGRMALLLGAVVTLIATVAFMGLAPPSVKDDDTVGRIALSIVMLAFLACLVVPVWYLWAGYRRSKGRFRLTSYSIAFFALLAMPCVATLTYGITQFGLGVIANDKEVLNSDRFMAMSDPPFVRRVSDSGCAGLLKSVTLDPEGKEASDFNSLTTFWFDQTLAGALFDWAEVFECRLSDYENDAKDVRFALIIVLYRLFAEIILVSVIIWPFVPLVRRIRRKEG